MSGPKLSAAELERLRQEQLERERQEALRRLREAQKIYRQAWNRIRDTKRYALSLMNQIDTMYKVTAQKEADTYLNQLKYISVEDEKNPEDYLTVANKMNQDADYVIEQIDKIFGAYITRSNTDKSLSKSDSVHQSFQTFIRQKTDPVDVSSIDFKSRYDRDYLMDKICQILAHYQWLIIHGKSDLQRQFATKSVRSIEKILDSQNTFKEKDVISYIQAIINEEADMNRRIAQIDALYDEYVALATLIDVEPKPPTDFANVDAIKKDITDFRDKLRKKDEMDYIADQINDAMISLGYGFVTSRVLMRKDQSEMDCSLYQADDRTGIAIYTDQTGAVMMRMTVLGDDTNITEDDKDFSLQRQIDFCAGHTDIVDALAERGVYLKQKSYLEPDKKHTYKVNMNTTVTTVQKDKNGQTVLKKNKIDRRKRRRAGKKKVRAM